MSDSATKVDKLWEPEENFLRVLTLQVSANRDHWSQWFSAERNRIAEGMAARGLLGSGPFFAALNNAAAAAVLGAGRQLVSDLIGTFDRVFGGISPEHHEWIRAYASERLKPWAEAWGREIEQAEARRQAGRAGAVTEGLLETAAIVRRELDIQLGIRAAQAAFKELTPPPRPSTYEADVFISHASEDKEAVAQPIAHNLIERGYKVWLDKFELLLGDRLLDKIDQGLAGCRFGVVILSPSFFGKNWPKRELAGLAAREDAEDRTIILPVWHQVDHSYIAAKSPTLAAVLGVDSAEGIKAITDAIVKVLERDRGEALGGQTGGQPNAH